MALNTGMRRGEQDSPIDRNCVDLGRKVRWREMAASHRHLDGRMAHQFRNGLHLRKQDREEHDQRLSTAPALWERRCRQTQLTPKLAQPNTTFWKRKVK